MITRRKIIGLGAAAVGLSLARLPPSYAAEWPRRTIKIIVPFAPGGLADIIARYLAIHLQEVLQQSVVVENRTGASGTIGTGSVAQAEPDGYTLIAISNTITANETLKPTRPYQLLRDLAPIALLSVAYNTLVVYPGLRAKTIGELIALAKESPGKMNYGTSGVGSVYHVLGEAFCSAAGIQVQHIPFRGSDQARTGVMSGTVDFMFDAIPTMLEQIRGGQVRAVATTGPRRDPLLPDTPTVAETLPDFEGSIWVGLLAPARTPPEIIQRLNIASNRFISMKSTQDWQAKLGATSISMSAADYGAFLQRDIDKQRKWIIDAKITAN